ncbi:RILP-like protein 1 isoform 2-T2 [Menidia menidia]
MALGVVYTPDLCDRIRFHSTMKLFLHTSDKSKEKLGQTSAEINKKRPETELERVEDVWRGEAQDLLSQIAQLQEENKHLLSNMPIKDSMNEEDLQRPEGSASKGPGCAERRAGKHGG